MPMGIEFTNPLALVLLALVPAALYLARHSLATLSRARAAYSIGARVALLLALIFALAGPRIKMPSSDLALIFLVDVSASVAQGEQRAAIELINSQIERAAPHDYLGVIAFGREPSVELAPTRKESLGEWRMTGISSNPPRDYTDISAALRLAAALVPESAAGRFVLISDGNENLDSAVKEAQILRASGIEVFTRPMSSTSGEAGRPGEVAVRDLSAPESMAEGEAFDLKATLDTTRDTSAVLRIFRNDSVVAERDVALSASGENLFVLPQRIEQKGFYAYRAEVEALGFDGFAQNNSREAFTLVEGRPKTLYLYGDAQPSPAIARVLGEGSFAFDTRPAAAAPTTLAGFQNYDLVIFDNVPATALTKEQMKMVQSYVRDLGGGFIMIGGDKSFGPGGYYKTPIEQTLPVSLDVRQKKHFPSLALALVIDKSGSMSGHKLQLAIEAAASAVEFLSERDSVGVVAFDDEAHPIVNLVRVEEKRKIIREIETLQPGGGTDIYSGVRLAHEWLAPSDAHIKHVILLSDGQSDGDYPPLMRSIRDANITLSAVAVGEDAEFGLMQMLANLGGGRFYASDSAENLPQIFTREASLASRTTIIEEPFVPRLARPTQATGGIDWSAAPALAGYVGTAERDPQGSPAITSLLSHKDDPVYAVWQYGLGRAAAFTSDAKSQWAGAWMGWPGFGQFWTQALRETLRREGATDLIPRVDINAGRGHVTVEAITPDGGFRNNLRLRARVVAPDFSATEVTLDQTAAGRYEGGFVALARGAYLVSVSEEGGSVAPVTGSVNSYSPEFAISSVDTGLLSQVSQAAGGRELSETVPLTTLFDRRAARSRPREIWEPLVLLALLLLPVDVGIRRLHIEREELARARSWVGSRLGRGASAEPGAEAAEAATPLTRLKGARSRVRLGEGERAVAELQRSEAQANPGPIIQNVDGATAGRADASGAAVAPPVAEPMKETPGAAQPLASRLLDARRKKRE